MDFTTWNFSDDLDRLKTRLLKPKLTAENRERIHDLIAACLHLTQDLEFDEDDDDEMIELSTTEATDANGVEMSSVNVNPLEIQLILNKVLRCLPVESLLNLRFVDRDWNSKAIHWIQKKNKALVAVNASGFGRLYSDFKDADALPFTKLSINISGLSLDLCTNFFTKFGSDIKELQLKEDLDLYPISEMIQEIRKKYQIILGHVPILKKLLLSLKSAHHDFFFTSQELDKVKLFHVECLELNSSVPLGQQFLDGLFRLIPNAKTMQLKNFAKDQDFEILAASLRSQNVHTIHRPIYTGPAAFWTALARESSPRLKLKELSIHFNLDLRCTSELLEAHEEFLESQAEDLETLSVEIRNSNPHLPGFQFPVMNKLTTLTVNVDSSYLREDGSGPVCLIFVPLQPDQIPNLRTVNLINPAIFTAQIFEHLFLDSVHEVNLENWSNKTFNYHSLDQITDWFPNIKKLTNLCTNMRKQESNVGLDYSKWGWHQSVMEMIVCELRYIEDLELTILDSSQNIKDFNFTITGIHRQCKWLLSDMEDHLGLETLLSWIHPGGYSIRDLKRLKRLVLVFDSHSEYARIDEIGVNLTFLRMSPDLRLTLRGDFMIEDDLAAKLTAHFKYLILAPTEPDPLKITRGSASCAIPYSYS